MRLIDADAAIEAVEKSMFENPHKDEIHRSMHNHEHRHFLTILRELESCKDVVSRNAIIQKLNEMDRYISTELRLCDTDKKFPQNEVFIVDDVYEKIVEQLPPAQPEYKTGQWISSDSELEIKCNKCGKDFSEYIYSIDYVFLAEYPKFCPNCGADMRGEENETD